MADDFLLTADKARFPLTAQLVKCADELETASQQALQVIGEDVPLAALRPEEIAALREAVAAAHGAGRDIRLIATAVQRRADGGQHQR
ncbi:hypothetical protein [Nocardia farcinica]|uniref:hypothetical protein n=1 Tax=Nocardia farcinica TaxID=37329 RepID=UPI0007618CDA|nr:hypothetical protein [Nocardia farcinica]AXK90021.1 hypothetical protein DXT66_30005 [Nocardia farcinica]